MPVRLYMDRVRFAPPTTRSVVPEKYMLTPNVEEASVSNAEETVSALDEQGEISIPTKAAKSIRLTISGYIIFADILF